MGAHIRLPIGKGMMKTTIEISDALLQDARRVAARDGITLRALVERGLRHVVSEMTPAAPFKLRKAGFKGEGLQAEFRDVSWERLRDAVYQDRGA
jgi:Arc/MetJ family transcription regulator